MSTKRTNPRKIPLLLSLCSLVALSASSDLYGTGSKQLFNGRSRLPTGSGRRVSTQQANRSQKKKSNIKLPQFSSCAPSSSSLDDDSFFKDSSPTFPVQKSPPRSGSGYRQGDDSFSKLKFTEPQHPSALPSYESSSGWDCSNDDLLELIKIKRSPDGKGNNQRNVDWGSSGIQLQRKASARYADGNGQPVNNLPGPRQISNAVGATGDSQTNPSDESFIFTIWGQFTDHDLDLTKEQEGNNIETIKVSIPKCDPFFDKACQGNKFIPFKRSKFTKKQPRQFSNVLTAFLDAGQVYGSDATTAKDLRQGRFGLMKESSPGLLPKNPQGQYIAGDIRVNENAILTSIHTIWIRQHNRICNQLRKDQPTLSDEESYTIAKNYVTGLIQKITYDDYLPRLLGQSLFNSIIGKYKRYDPRVKPNILVQFSTAVYRFGHSLLINEVPQINYQNRVIKTFKVNQLFFNPSLINQNSVDFFLNGASQSAAKKKNGQIVNAVRNFLIPGPQDRQTDLDLFVLNVQRARDHGLSSYTDYRRIYNLNQLRGFHDITSTFIADRLKSIYKNVDDIDLWVGIVTEESVCGGVLGELGTRIVGQTFRNIRDGDRFWYQGVYPKSIIKEIKQTTFSDVIRRNTKLKSLPYDIFAAPKL